MLLPIGDDTYRRRTPFVTYLLIAVNVWVFLTELSRGNPFVLQWSFVPSRFIADPVGQFPTIFTAMFMHAGWLHLAGNMLYLWIFGDNVEDRFGHGRFLLFYLACGVVATFAQFALSTGSNVVSLGASGAIAGVLAAYVVLFPGGRVRVLVSLFVIELPALVVIGGWIVMQALNGFGTITQTAEMGGVAYMAHVGGFVSGLVLTFAMRARKAV